MSAFLSFLCRASRCWPGMGPTRKVGGHPGEEGDATMLKELLGRSWGAHARFDTLNSKRVIEEAGDINDRLLQVGEEEVKVKAEALAVTNRNKTRAEAFADEHERRTGKKPSGPEPFADHDEHRIAL